MDFVLLAFYALAAIAVMAAVAVISVRNPVHSVLFLVLTFFSVACTWIIAGAEFLGLALILVYVGAIMVLFLFVVMMLDIDFAELRAGFVKNFPLGIAVAVILLAELILGIGAYQAGALELGTPDGTAAPMIGESNIENIGALMFGKYLLLFEVAGMILLVAMVGAIVLTHRGNRSPRAHQNIAKQIARRPEEATVNTRPEVGQGVKL